MLIIVAPARLIVLGKQAEVKVVIMGMFHLAACGNSFCCRSDSRALTASHKRGSGLDFEFTIKVVFNLHDLAHQVRE